MTEQELRDKARDVASNYYRIYGKYPEKVGIDRLRLNSMHTDQIAFPVILGKIPPLWCEESEDPLNTPMPTASMQIVRFAPYAGGNPDEVYVPRPKDNRKAASGAAIARLAEIIEGRKKRAEEVHYRYVRYFNGPMVMQSKYRMGPLLADNED